MALVVSERPVKSDVLNIATALGKVLNLPTDNLASLDAREVCSWMEKNLPSLNSDNGITENPKHQKNICQKLSLMLPESAQQKDACAGVAEVMCDLARVTKASLSRSIEELNSRIAACGDDECRTKLQACLSKSTDTMELLTRQSEVVNGYSESSNNMEAKNPAAWSEKMTAAISAAPCIADMIILVCDANSEIESLCAECRANATVSGGCGCDSGEKLFTGGWTHGGGITMDLDTRKQTETRRRALNSFINEAKELFDQVLNAVYALGQRMGSGSVAIDDDFLRFRNAFNDLENIYRPGIEYVLTGYFVHARATEHRDRFLGKLQSLISTLVPLSSGQNGDLFKKIKEPLEALQKHCDKYSDQFRQGNSALIQTKFGAINENPTWGGDFRSRMESVSENARLAAEKATSVVDNLPGAINHVAEKVGETRSALGNLASAAQGGFEYLDEISGGVVSRAGLTLKNVKKSLEHFYRVAKMRDNFKTVAAETKNYNANYSKVVGEPLAAMIDKENAAFEKLKAELMTPVSSVAELDKLPRITAVYNTIKKAVDEGSSGGDNIARDWNREAITTMALNSHNAKIELLKVVQSIDLFLMNFTDATIANPSEISEISKLLDSTEIIAEMFNEASGDYIAALFEFMPWNITASMTGVDVDGKTLETHWSKIGENILDVQGARLKKMDKPYIGKVKDVVMAGGGGSPAVSYPGNPFLMISPARAEYAREFAKKTVERIMALKNIVAAFCFMGSKSKSGELWEPNRIHGALCKYMYVSAFAMGWDGYDLNTPGYAPGRQEFAKFYRLKNTLFPTLNSRGAGNAIRDNGMIKNSGAGRGILTGVMPFLSGQAWVNILKPTGLFKYQPPSTDATAAATSAAAAAAEHKSAVEERKGAEIALAEAIRARDEARNAATAAVAAAAGPRVRIPPPPPTVGGAILTTNWAEYVNSLEPSGDTRGWIIAYDPNPSKDMTIVPPFARRVFGCAMNSIPLDKDAPGPTKTVGGWSAQFRETDMLFIKAIKAMVAKIMTVTGMYNILNYSSDEDHSMSAMRFTMGGSVSGGAADLPSNTLPLASVPHIHEDAVELYLRLPLMVEFYRDIFSLTGKRLSVNDDDKLIVTLVPEMDLTWSGIMRLSFDNMNGANTVTKNYAAQMITEINKIYEKYKGRGSANLVSSVIGDFVTDVNRRYGLMSRVESVKYREMMQANRRAYNESGEDDIFMDFDTLGDRDYADRKAAALPSDQFMKTKSGDPATAYDPTDLKMTFIDSITKFREHIDDKIRAVTHGPTGGAVQIKSDFHEQTRITKNELKSTTDPEKRFNIVFGTLSGIDSLSKVDDAAHVMFHETILAPLAVIEQVAGHIYTFIAIVNRYWGDMINAARLGFSDAVLMGVPYPPGSTSLSIGNKILIDLTKSIMGHVSSLSGMVNLGIDGKKVILDHSKLQNFTEELLDFVSRNLQKFRGVISESLIVDCESRIQVINSNLVEVTFQNEVGDEKSNNLEKISSLVTRMYGMFASGLKNDVYGSSSNQVVFGTATNVSLVHAITSLAYYDPQAIRDNFANVKCVLTRNDVFDKLFMKKIDGKDLYMHEDLMFTARYEIYSASNEFSNNAEKNRSMGLMMRFNELVARYLNQFWDVNSAKIYLPLILNLASANDAAVHKGTGWPDLVRAHGYCDLPLTLFTVAPAAGAPHAWNNWANQLSEEIKAGNLTAGFLTPNIIGTGPIPYADRQNFITREAVETFLQDLGNTSSQLAPVQIINLLKHAFDSNASRPGVDRSQMETVRASIISSIGNNWTKYGPIAAIFGCQCVYGGSPRAINPNTETILAAAGYKPPEIIPSQTMGFAVPEPPSHPARGNPDEILFASLAKILRTMLTAREKDTALYTVASLSESLSTTPRMKENIRANLPIFVKMFEMLAEDCKILGNILTIGITIDDHRPRPINGLAEILDVQGRLFMSDRVNGAGDEFKGDAAINYVQRLLNKIIKSCESVVRSSEDVMREVSDNPLYLEVEENSISAYRSSKYVEPFMPLSSILTPLKNIRGRELLPLFTPGSREFEFNYGTRLILGRPKVLPLLDHAPGVREIVDSYNKLAQGDKQISLDSISKSIPIYVQLSRWLTDLQVYSPILLSNDWRIATVPMVTDGKTYQLNDATTLDMTMDLTTGPDKRRSIARLSEWVLNSKLAGAAPGPARDSVINREKMQIWNIMDMNINPINLNALRREIPLINVINYSSTFDAYIKDMLKLRVVDPTGAVVADPQWGPNTGDVKTNEAMFLALSLDPYRQKNDFNEWRMMFNCFSDESQKIFRNFTGHDRFAVDQVFRKALLFFKDNEIRTPVGRVTRDGYFLRKTNQDGKNRDDLIAEIDIAQDAVEVLNVLGMMRHDTTFIRNILFISMTHRILRARMNEEMMRVTFPVVRGANAVAPRNTEEDMWSTIDDTRLD